MSVSRDVIVDVIGIPEDKIRCDNCKYVKKWINDAYLCSFWHDQMTYADCFCSFFREGQPCDTK